MQKIVVDIYGADAGIAPVVNGVAKALKKGLDFFPVFVGERAAIRQLMDGQGIDETGYEVVDTDAFITNNDPPTAVFGGNDNASMVMALTRLKTDDECVAMLSPGNTGALLVGSICRLGLVGGLKFPILASALPCADVNRLVCLLDCGANIECTAADLERFARLGHAFAQSACGIESPRIGLMSVGREKGKGNTLTKEAYERIEKLPVNFVGNIEGGDMVNGYADVVITDGFSGNLLLKNAEAVGKAAAQIVKQTCPDPALAEQMSEAILKRFDFNSQGGATFLGPIKTVVKMHGCANDDTAVACIEQIMRLHKNKFSENVARALQA